MDKEADYYIPFDIKLVINDTDVHDLHGVLGHVSFKDVIRVVNVLHPATVGHDFVVKDLIHGGLSKPDPDSLVADVFSIAAQLHAVRVSPAQTPLRRLGRSGPYERS